MNSPFASFERIEKRILNALRNGPVEVQALDEVVKVNATQRRRALQSLTRQGKIEPVPKSRPLQVRLKAP